MKHAEQRGKKLQEVLCANKIAIMLELKEELGTNSTMTVFRALSSLGSLTSYSHRGGYYTLPCIPDFDMSGLWAFGSVGFSRHGNLLDTVKALVETSGDGRTVSELDATLQVETRHAVILFFSLLDERQRRLYAGLSRLGGDMVATSGSPNSWTWIRTRCPKDGENSSKARFLLAACGRKAAADPGQKKKPGMLEYSLKSNKKCLSSGRSAGRDCQLA